MQSYRRVNLTQSSPVQLFWVPCTYDSKTSTFSPIYSLATYPLPPASHSAGGAPTDTSWAEAEDEQLRVLVRELGLKQWIKIAIALNQEFHQSTAVRRGKQCRERWYNHLDPELNSNAHAEGEWSLEEDVVVLQQQAKKGKKWAKIAKCLCGRTENAVKNRFNSLLRKARTQLSLPTASEDHVRDSLLGCLAPSASS